MRTRISRSVAAALVGALALTSLDLTPAQAAVSKDTQAKQSAATTEFSARRHWRRGNGAVLGAAAGVFGAIALAAAANRYRDDYYYYGNPYAYGPYPGPYYYGGYGYRHRWHRHH